MPKRRKTSETLAARIERAVSMVYFDGAKEAQIAEALGIRSVSIRDWKRRPEWAAAVAELRAHQRKLAFDRLEVLTPRAASAIDECLASDNETIKFKAATWVLGRAKELIGEDSAPSRNRPSGTIESFVNAVISKSGNANDD